MAYREYREPVVTDGMKTTRNGPSEARHYMLKRTRNTSAITEDNTVKQQGTVKRSLEKLLCRYNKGSNKDFVSKDKEK